MANKGMNWLLGTAALVAVAAIGVGVYVLNTGSSSQQTASGDGTLVTPVRGSGQQSGGVGTDEEKAAGNADETQVAALDPQETPSEPEAPVQAAPVEIDNTPTFDVMRVEPTGDAVVAGRTEAGAVVVVVADGKIVGRGVANANGEFAIVLDKPLPPGNHDVSLEATNETTQEKSVSKQRIAVSIPKEQGGEVLVVLNDPDGPSTVLQLPEVDTQTAAAAPQTQTTGDGLEADAQPASEADQQVASAAPTGGAAVSDGNLRVEAVESQDGKVYVAGEGAPGSKVRVYVGEDLIGEVTTDKNGRWLVEGARDVATGNVEVRADQVKGSEGEVVARAEVTFAKTDDKVILQPLLAVASGTASGAAGATIEAGVGELPNVIIRKGDNLWTISRRVYGDGFRYTTIYQANDRQIRNPDLIYPGQVFVLPESDLNWQEETN
ncbi:LysM peptidoglycan-binding domain-containing protein [Pseudovibrio sp. SPO723]|uniref:LysM peptidoglycan-binding domain-containing protein n=1 Tax=Nesiotobacter zosterae TaxID=392721 RepID=UPI0029C4E091|nr:LysM peptidoglycan-binding domain-containing protein [Pseudovibrio sp. SPO723]MDX5593720.1 LysM peptidoglycan-binding domain-containing protein [Pseudovibrio sp. SPO723]